MIQEQKQVDEQQLAQATGNKKPKSAARPVLALFADMLEHPEEIPRCLKRILKERTELSDDQLCSNILQLIRKRESRKYWNIIFKFLFKFVCVEKGMQQDHVLRIVKQVLHLYMNTTSTMVIPNFLKKYKYILADPVLL